MSEGGTFSKAEGKDSKGPKRHRSRSRVGTGTSATSKRRKSKKRHAGETPTPSTSRVSEASMLLPSNTSTPLMEAVSSTTISIDPGADLAANRSATSTPVPEFVPENATMTTTRGAAGPCGKSSSVIRDEKLGSIALAAEASESTGITHGATDPDMAAAIDMRDVDESENVLAQSRPVSGYAPIEKDDRLVMPPSLELPSPAVCHDGQDPTLSPSPKRKSRALSTVTFGDAQSYRLTSAEPSTSEILGQGSHQLRILACAQLSLGALAFHYQSMRLLAPVDAVDHWCRQPPEFANQSAQAWKNASIPVGPDGRYSRCSVYRFPYSHGTAAAATSGSASSSALWPGVVAGPRGELPCSDWDYDLPPDVLTALNEWDLVCSNAWLVLAARLYTYLGGVVCAPFLGKMADRTGRRPVLLACAVLAVAAAALTVHAHSFLQLVLLRMVVAGSLNGFSLVSIVLLFEVTYEASRKSKKRHAGETPTPSPSRVSEASMLLPSNASMPLKEAVSSTTISIDPGADLAATRSATSTPVANVVPENATTTTTPGAAGPCGKSSSVIGNEKLGSIALAAEASESTGTTHAATDPDMAAAIDMRDVDEPENVLAQSQPVSGYAPIEKDDGLVMPPSLELPSPALSQDGQDPTLSPSPKRKSRGLSTVTFGDAQSYRLTSAEPSTSEILRQGSHQLRILACAQLSLGALAFHYQSMRLLAPVHAVDHWCRQPPEFANQSAQAWKHASVPVAPDGRYSRCTVYRFPYSHGTAAAATSGSASSSALWPGVVDVPRAELPCRDWDYDLPPDVLTALNEWDLVCSNAWLVLAARLYTYLGGVVCAPFLGKMADRTGRRPVLLACAVLAVAAAALTVRPHSFLQLILLRMVVAGSLNGFSLVSIVLLFEVTYEASRTDYLCGAMAASIICGWAPCLLSAAEHVFNRRALAFAFLVPVSLLLTSFQAVRESSRWLLVTGGVADFIDRHNATSPHGGGRRSDVEMDRGAVRRLRDARAAATAEGHRTTEASLQPGSAGSTIVLPGFVARTASLSVLFLSQIVIMNETSECGEPERDLSSPAPSSWRAVVLVIPRAVSILLAARFLRRCERKRALMLGLPLSCAAFALLALVELALPRGDSYVYVVVGELVLASAFANLAFACVYSLELYATADRAAGFATVCSSGVLGGVALMSLFESQDPAVRKMLGLSLAIVALLLVEQLPETKDARVPDALFDAISQLKRYSMSSSSKSFAEPRPSTDSGCLPQGKLFATCD
ncbi:uncharacterized protein [Dermacentor albipictus]|uniref:uncharacterized protein isoform X2 n=1 Tax=Dermacentor albipictus TaxID=60249 RepID=UPI0038FC7DC0